jgi:hypothetical protein
VRAGPLDLPVEAVEADERRRGKCPSQLDRRKPRAAPDIGAANPGAQLLDDTIDRRQPLLDERVLIPRPPEAGHPLPRLLSECRLRDTTARAERLDQSVDRAQVSERQLKRAAEEARPAFCCEHRRLLGWEHVAARLRVERHVSGGVHAAKPFARVALPDPRPLGELR